MSKLILERSNGFWWYMGGLIIVGLAVVFFVAYIATERGGRLSDIPLYVYLPLILIGLDLYRRLSFYFGHRDDKLFLEKGKITLCRSGIKKVFEPTNLKEIKVNRGFGFIFLKTYGDTSFQLQPWLFGKSLGKLKKLIRECGFSVE